MWRERGQLSPLSLVRNVLHTTTQHDLTHQIELQIQVGDEVLSHDSCSCDVARGDLQYV